MINSWNVTGEVLRFGVKGKQYPKLWVQLQLPLPKNSTLSENKVFVNFDLDPNTSSKNGKIGQFIQSKLETAKFACLTDATIAYINTSKKLEDGTWANEEVIGIRGKLLHFNLSDNRYPIINHGFAKGIASKYNFNNKEERFIIDDKYRNPKTNEWKTRHIPVLDTNVDSPVDLTGKSVFVSGSLCGTTPSGESKVFVWTDKKIVLG